MRFLQPQYLKLFLILAALFPLWTYRLWVKAQTRGTLGDSQPLRKLSHLSSLRREFAQFLLFSGVLAALILALAQPQISREKKVPLAKRMDLVFLLDTSPSMRAEDIRPSRLERALEVIGSFSRKRLAEDRVALVGFAEGSLILSYLTEDPDNILYYLDYLREETAPAFGTNIGRALKSGLEVVAKEIERRPASASHKRVFILLSDGEDHGEELAGALEDVKKLGVRVHTIGIGSREGAPIPISHTGAETQYLEDAHGQPIIAKFDEKTLRWIADETGGRAYRSFTGRELESTFAEIVLKEREVAGFKKVMEHENIHLPFLLGALGVFLAALLV